MMGCQSTGNRSNDDDDHSHKYGYQRIVNERPSSDVENSQEY